jgi:hypothetical protein
MPGLPQIAGYNGMPPPRAMECGRCDKAPLIGELWMSPTCNLMNFPADACFMASRDALGRLLCLGHDGTLCVSLGELLLYRGLSSTVIGHARWAPVSCLGCKGMGMRCQASRGCGTPFFSLTPFNGPDLHEMVVCIKSDVLTPACRPSVIGVTQDMPTIVPFTPEAEWLPGFVDLAD